MTNGTLKNASKISVLADELLTDAYHTMHSFKEHELEVLGAFALLFIPILDIIKALLYWMKAQDEAYIKRKGQKYATVTSFIHGLKAVVTTLGMLAVFGGATLLGFGLIAAANGMIACRSLAKAGHALFVDKDLKKTGKHLLKFVVSSLFTVSFTILFMIPHASAALSLAGWGMVLAATVIGVAPGIIKRVSGFFKPKNSAYQEIKDDKEGKGEKDKETEKESQKEKEADKETEKQKIRISDTGFVVHHPMLQKWEVDHAHKELLNGLEHDNNFTSRVVHSRAKEI